MASTRDWLASRLADQAVVFANVAVKIAGYQGVLGLTAAQVSAIVRICTEFGVAYSFTEQSRATTVSLVQWRDTVLKGTPQGTPIPAAPAYGTPDMPTGSTIGIIAEFRDLRDIILASPGYTDLIGADLMIVATGGGSGPHVPVDEAVPVINCHVGAGYEIDITGPMHGMDAMRIEWQPNGSATWSLVGFLTKTPGAVIISVPVPGEPVSGRIRARYIHNNLPVGDYSQEVAVTVSA